MKTPTLLGVIGSILLAAEASAYEQLTHAAMTQSAYLRSHLGSLDHLLQNSLGLSGFWAGSTDGVYFDLAEFSEADALPHYWQDFENAPLRDRFPPNDASPRAWLLRGAIREDDNPNEEPPTPQDVSPGLRRPLH